MLKEAVGRVRAIVAPQDKAAELASLLTSARQQKEQLVAEREQLRGAIHSAGVAAFLGEPVPDTMATTQRLSEVETEIAASDARVLQIQDAQRALAAKVEDERRQAESVWRENVAKDARAASRRALEAFGQLERANTELLELLPQAAGAKNLPSAVPPELLEMIRRVLSFA